MLIIINKFIPIPKYTARIEVVVARVVVAMIMRPSTDASGRERNEKFIVDGVSFTDYVSMASIVSATAMLLLRC